MHLTFFVLPPHAMAWPDGSGLTVLEAAEDTVPPQILVSSTPVVGSDQQWWVQLVFHQRQTTARQDDDVFLIVDTVMRESAGMDEPSVRPTRPWFSPDAHRETVVEITTPLDLDDEEHLFVAVGRGLDALRDADRALLLSNGDARTPLAPADVWPIVPCLRRNREDGALLGPPKMLVLDTNELRDRPVPDLLDEEARSRVEAALSAIQAHHPFVRWGEWLSSAEEARNATRPEDAVIRLGVAVEVMLDAVLAISLWEMNTTALDAASTLGAELSRRLRHDFPRVLGGSWDRTRGPLALWSRDLAYLRGRVVHRGHRPDELELRRAFVAAERLHRHVVEQVVRRRSELPKTAWSLLGPAGLKEEDAWDGAVRRLGSDGDLANEDWLLSYTRWRNKVDDLLRDG